MDNSISDFLLYYNDRLHSITYVASYRAMMNANDKELMEKKIKKNILKENYKLRQFLRLILMAVMLESQITLKLLIKNMSFLSSNRITKVLIKEK